MLYSESNDIRVINFLRLFLTTRHRAEWITVQKSMDPISVLRYSWSRARFSLRSKRFRGVREQRKSEKRGCRWKRLLRRLGQIDLFGMVSFYYISKINVRVGYFQNVMSGKHPVSEVKGIQVSFRRKNFAEKKWYDAGLMVFAADEEFPVADIVDTPINNEIRNSLWSWTRHGKELWPP